MKPAVIASKRVDRSAGSCAPFYAAAGTSPDPPAQRESQIRVCFLIDRLATAGTETQLLALIHHLHRERVVPYLCLLDGEDPLSRSLEPAGCPVLRLGIKSLRSIRALRGVRRLAWFLRELKIDVLQVYFPDSTYMGVAAGRWARVPHIVRMRNNLGYWMTARDRRLARLVGRWTSVVVANSEACRQAVLADEGLPPASVVVLENGVDLPRFLGVRTVQAHEPVDGVWRVGAVANLRPVKGLDVLIEAAARVTLANPNVRFEVAGDGEQRHALEEQIRRLQLEKNFILHGSRTDVPEFLATLDVAVMSSRSEGMPNAVLEYMAAGRPIVATAVGATPQLIQNEIHGLLVDPEGPDRLAAGIIRLLRDRSLAAHLATAARARVAEKYGRESMVRRFEDFYQNLVASTRTQ